MQFVGEDIPEITSTGRLADRTLWSFVEAPKSPKNMAKLIAFKTHDYQAGSLTVDQSLSLKSSGTGYNNQIGSIIVVSGTWRLFKNADQTDLLGEVFSAGGPAGDGCYPVHTDWSGGENNISYIELVH